ncbi:uncharacterized protein [Ambystoma mexicanum]|uniref:uncharacterized protein n=1 Tax=Ambystoma mexicanum TaxID=8296 RepID=UPI0037E90A9F
MPDMDNFRQEALIIPTVEQLKEMCTVRNLPVKGKKNELIERLLNHQNLNSRSVTPAISENVGNVDEDDNDSESNSNVIEESEELEESWDVSPYAPQQALSPQPLATGTLPGPACSHVLRQHLADSNEIDPKKLAREADSWVANSATHKELGATNKKDEGKQHKGENQAISNPNQPEEAFKPHKDRSRGKPGNHEEEPNHEERGEDNRQQRIKGPRWRWILESRKFRRMNTSPDAEI